MKRGKRKTAEPSDDEVEAPDTTSGSSGSNHTLQGRSAAKRVPETTRARNRAAQARFRRKQKLYYEALHEEVAELRRDKEELVRRTQSLEARLRSFEEASASSGLEASGSGLALVPQLFLPLPSFITPEGVYPSPFVKAPSASPFLEDAPLP